ncbi:MAG: DUF2179 domain-containing protein [Rhodothermaceae bacterium]|nr:DUF2179 domain-containing protein [Rhodothermaceae bacterium]
MLFLEVIQVGPFDWMTWVILPLLIFFARILDVSLGTLRIIFVSRSMKRLAVLVGFFESLIWLIAISQIVQNLTNVVTYVAFAGGFAAGNFVGIYLEGKIAVGLLCVRAITRDDASKLVEFLKDQNYGVTTFSARGVQGRVRLLYMVIKRRDLNQLLKIIKDHDPKAFITIEDVRAVNEGFFPHTSSSLFSRMTSMRK